MFLLSFRISLCLTVVAFRLNGKKYCRGFSFSSFFVLMQKISSEISKALGRLFMERYEEASNDESSSCKSKKFLSRIHQSFPIPPLMPALHSLPCEHRKKVVKKWKPHCNGKMKKNSLATRKSGKSGKNEKQHVLRANNDTVLMHILPYV